MGRSVQRLSRPFRLKCRPAVTILVALCSGMWCCEAAEAVRLAGTTMGTTYQVRLVADLPAEAEDALRGEIDALLEEIDDQMSTYRRASEISRFNRAVGGEWFAVSPATAAVVSASLEVSRKTGGALDVTVGPVVRLWHFGPPMDNAGTTALVLAPPSDEQLEAAHAVIGYEKLEVRREPPALRKQVDGLEIDLSAIAKGYAVDRVAELLSGRDVADYMIEVGGEVRVAGRRANGQPWRIAVERPVRNRRELHKVLALADGGLATSGDYRNYFEHDGRRYSHIIDPNTSRPVEHGLASVSVAAETCMMADAWSTALLVLGGERGLACAERHGVAALFIFSSEPDDSERATSTWKAKFGSHSR